MFDRYEGRKRPDASPYSNYRTIFPGNVAANGNGLPRARVGSPMHSPSESGRIRGLDDPVEAYGGGSGPSGLDTLGHDARGQAKRKSSLGEFSDIDDNETAYDFEDFDELGGRGRRMRRSFGGGVLRMLGCICLGMLALLVLGILFTFATRRSERERALAAAREPRASTGDTDLDRLLYQTSGAGQGAQARNEGRAPSPVQRAPPKAAESKGEQEQRWLEKHEKTRVAEDGGNAQGGDGGWAPPLEPLELKGSASDAPCDYLRILKGEYEAECRALVAFAHATSYKDWNLQEGWCQPPRGFEAFDGGAVHHCMWFGVSCTGTVAHNPPHEGESHVKELFMDANGIVGPLTAAMARLPYLQTLRLPDNPLSATIPAFLVRMPRLATIDLSNCRLSGQLPSTARSKSLRELLLDHNELEGTVPALGGMHGYGKAGFKPTPLERISLSFNNLRGTIPSLAGLSMLKHLSLDHNTFNNVDPDMCSVQVRLSSCKLGANKFNCNVYRTCDLGVCQCDHNPHELRRLSALADGGAIVR
eukprot:g8175.t1